MNKINMLTLLKKMHERYPDDIEITIAIKELKEEIVTKCYATSRRGLIKNLIKNNDKKPYRYNYYHVCDGKHGFTDGYRVYVLEDDYTYKNTVDDGKSLSEAIMKLKPNLSSNTPIVHFDVADIKEMCTNENKITAIFKTSYIDNRTGKKMEIGFNAHYLLEFCEMFRTDSLYVNTPISPCYACNDIGEWGVLCPVRLK